MRGKLLLSGLVLFVLLCSSLVISVEAASAEDSLIYNSGFEGGIAGWAHAGTGFLEVTNSNVRSGNYSMEISSSIEQQAYFYQYLDFPNISFVFSFWLLRANTNSWTACYLAKDWDQQTARIVSSIVIQDNMIELNAWDNPYAPGRQMFNYSVTAGSWHNMTFSANRTSKTQNFYIDGSLITTLNSSSGNVFSPDILIFGDVSNESCNGHFYFDDFVLSALNTADGTTYISMWSQTYGGAEGDVAYSLVATSDGGYALTGFTQSFGAGGMDAWLVKTDASGNLQWNRTYGGTGNEEARSLTVTSDGGYAIAGIWNYTGPFGNGGDFWLVKTDSNGVMEWSKTYGRSGKDEAYSLVATSDGGYAIAGSTDIFDVQVSDFWLIKTDTFGNMQWNQTYGGTGYDVAYSLVVTSDGGYALMGGSLLVKTDSFGNVQWNQTYGGTDAVVTSDGGYAIVGYTGLFVDQINSWLMKTDALGNMQWNKPCGKGIANSLVATSDGGYAIGGYTEAYGIGGEFWLVKTDSFGNMQWNKTYGGTGYDDALSLVATSDGGYALAGDTDSVGAGSADFWLVRTSELGVYPEYSSLLVPAFVLAATAFIIISKKRLFRTRS